MFLLNGKKYIRSTDIVQLYGINKDQIRYLCKRDRIKYILLSGKELREFKRKNDIYNSYASSLYLIESNSLDLILSIYSNKNNKAGDIC
mgnify:CR=1 FL=1|jgi:hypothetical protein